MKFPSEARSTTTEQLLFSRWCFLLDSKDVELSILGDYEHALSRE